MLLNPMVNFILSILNHFSVAFDSVDYSFFLEILLSHDFKALLCFLELLPHQCVPQTPTKFCKALEPSPQSFLGFFAFFFLMIYLYLAVRQHFQNVYLHSAWTLIPGLCISSCSLNITVWISKIISDF